MEGRERELVPIHLLGLELFLFKVTFLDFLAFEQVGKRAAEREEKKGEGGEFRKQAPGHLYEDTTTSWGVTLSAWPSAPLGVWLLSSLRECHAKSKS